MNNERTTGRFPPSRKPGVSLAMAAPGSETSCLLIAWPLAARPLALPFVFALTKFSVHMALWTRFGIHRDEYYFFECARRLAWGYVDHAPFVPFLAGRAMTDPSAQRALSTKIIFNASGIGFQPVSLVSIGSFLCIEVRREKQYFSRATDTTTNDAPPISTSRRFFYCPNRG